MHKPDSFTTFALYHMHCTTWFSFGRDISYVFASHTPSNFITTCIAISYVHAHNYYSHVCMYAILLHTNTVDHNSITGASILRLSHVSHHVLDLLLERLLSSSFFVFPFFLTRALQRHV